jgi:protein-disulfide isomerase
LLLSLVLALPSAVKAQPVDLAALMVESPLGDLWLGTDKAPVTIIEYASMTCPHCAAFHNDVFAEFRAQYIDTGKVRFIIREFPLDDWAVAGFALARCVAAVEGAEGYYATIARLFEQQAAWAGNMEGLTAQVTEAGLVMATFGDTCYTPLFDGIIWSYNRGIELGVTGTPTFFINGEMHVGALPLAELGQIVDRML